mgnify:CR=1 FL=1
MEDFMMFTIYAGGLNLLLSALLVWVYAQNYRALKSNVGLGLLVFASLILIQNVAGVYFHVTTGEFYAKMLATQAFALEALESVALAAMAWVAWKE